MNPTSLFHFTARVAIALALIGSVNSNAGDVPASHAAMAESRNVVPDDSEYVTVRDGHLQLKGERQRFWGVIGSFPGNPKFSADDSPAQREAKVAEARANADAIVQRFSDLGFNFVRYWYAAGTLGQSPAPLAERKPYVMGDGSPDDIADYFLARLKERGFRVWTAGLNQLGSITPDDVSIVDDKPTEKAWREAVAEAIAGQKPKPGKPPLTSWILKSPAQVWDPRLEALTIARMKAIADHKNQYTGLRWADDPLFCVWELSNEQWWVRRMLAGSWQKLPSFFKNSLIARWNEYLRRKYTSEDSLKKAWGSLLPGENLDRGTILFAPMSGATSTTASFNDSNPEALAAMQGLKQEYKREDFPAARASDVIEFLLDLHISHKKRLEVAVKSWGKSTRLSPLVMDTGLGYDIHSQFAHQQFDATAHDAYTNGWGPEFKEPDLAALPNDQQRAVAQLGSERVSRNQTDGWINWLSRPPGLAQGVPWLEAGSMPGKPFFGYETQIQQPAKYRADYPLRLLALAAIQDWDIICWHYWGPAPHAALADGFSKAMDVTTGTHPQGYHFTYDEVQAASMRFAGHCFRQGLYLPAAKPTTFIYGKKSLLSPDTMNSSGSYGMSGLDILQTTYQYGSRVLIDPSRDSDEVIGPVVKFEDRATHNPYTPTPEITFDWKQGYLSMDSPTAVGWTGLAARQGNSITFRHGVTLSEVKLVNPPDIFSPVAAEENYIAFMLYSQDGLPFAKTKRASLSLASTSFNSGFRLDPTKLAAKGNGLQPGAVVAGKAPVLVTRAGAILTAPALAGMTYTLRDWNMKSLGSGTIPPNGVLKLEAADPIWVVELTREPQSGDAR